jgi:lysozyme family protein
MISTSTFYNQILPFTLKSEGGYSNISNDRGGETYRGITRYNWPNWNGWAVIDRLKPLAHNQFLPELEPLVKEFYFKNFFASKGFQYLNNVGTATALFDFAVNGGYSSKEFFTRFNAKFNKYIPVNSVVNAESLTLVNAANQSEVQKMVMDWRVERYKKLATSDPTQKVFFKGWMNRMSALNSFIGAIRQNPVKTLLIAIAALLILLALVYGKDWRALYEKLA